MTTFIILQTCFMPEPACSKVLSNPTMHSTSTGHRAVACELAGCPTLQSRHILQSESDKGWARSFYTFLHFSDLTNWKKCLPAVAVIDNAKNLHKSFLQESVASYLPG